MQLLESCYVVMLYTVAELILMNAYMHKHSLHIALKYYVQDECVSINLYEVNTIFAQG